MLQRKSFNDRVNVFSEQGLSFGVGTSIFNIWTFVSTDGTFPKNYDTKVWKYFIYFRFLQTISTNLPFNTFDLFGSIFFWLAIYQQRNSELVRLGFIHLANIFQWLVSEYVYVY